MSVERRDRGGRLRDLDEHCSWQQVMIANHCPTTFHTEVN